MSESCVVGRTRPAAEWPVVGHEWAVQALRQAVEAGRVFHAYLITGPDGVGKMMLAQALAAALVCESEEEVPCNSCRSCRLVQSSCHPDVHVVEPEDEAANLKIEQVRDLQRQLALTPLEGRKRVAILRRFGAATTAAANALLKTLEEPPAHVVLALLAEDADRLLPTVVSRCRHIALRPLSVGLVKRSLIERWDVEPERAELLARLSGGRLGWAAEMSEDESALASRNQRLDDMEELIKAPLVERFRYAEDLAGDKVATAATLELWTGAWRDVMLLAAGAPTETVNVDRRGRMQTLAKRIGVEKSGQVLQALRSAFSLLKRNANPRLTLEVLMLDLPRL